MAREIEKKFLVKEGAWRNEKGTPYRQGYLNSVKERVVRVRTINDKGYLTIKGLTVGASRLEFEYEIPCRIGCRKKSPATPVILIPTS